MEMPAMKRMVPEAIAGMANLRSLSYRAGERKPQACQAR